MTLIEIISLVF